MKYLKKIGVLLACALMITATAPMTAIADTAKDGDFPADVQQDNFTRTATVEAFGKGTLKDVEIVSDAGDGAVRLTQGKTEGTWTSPKMDVPAFEYMVASWSADTPEGTYVEIQARAYVDMHKTWTEWQSWGQWGTTIKRASANTSGERAMVNTDTMIILGDDGETASKIQLKAILHTDNESAVPTLRDVSTTLANTLEGQEIPVYHPNKDMELPDKVILDTPAYSQLRRDFSINGVICSPTTMTMMLNDRDSSLDLFPEEVALKCYDFEYKGFGNWAYTVAAAGSYGFSGYAHYADLDFLRQELAAGRSVGISVEYANKENGGYPYLENAATESTGGHLIPIVGYETIDGVDYFYSNDSATTPDADCALRRYRADQLEECWSSGIAYVVSSQAEENAGQSETGRVEASLEKTDEDNVYSLLVDGKETALSKSFAAKTNVLGAGIILIVPNNGNIETMPEPVETTTANKDLVYCKSDGAGHILVDSDKMKEAGANGGTCYVITNNGVTYVAQLLENGGSPAAVIIIVIVAVAAVVLGIIARNISKKKQK